jgi:ABC-type bacteriocin/lantibiotic exporter with double-glycine peptidase domain
LQDPSLFDDSVRRNIALGSPELTLADVEEAARLACLHDEIMQMPMGYETPVGERGAKLSGGQRQRLALARALASRPRILVLDEATSHLDVVTEGRVDENLDRLACTRLVIAHRLSTIRNADLIVVLDQGTIVDQGSHEELLNRNGLYAALVRQQLAQAELAG